jgi:hypothetical protein
MAWRGKGRSRERIGLYGGEGSGKSTAVLSVLGVALSSADTGYIIDTDNSYARFLEGSWEWLGTREEYEGRVRVRDYESEDGRLVLYHATGWEEERWAFGEAFKRAGRDDWVVGDSTTHLWDHVARWYIRKVHGADFPEFLVQHRIDQLKENKGADGGAGATLVEWPYINAEWSQHVMTPVVNARCHVIMTAEAKSAAARSDGKNDREVLKLYERLGSKPASQKRWGHNMHSTILMEKGMVAGKWTMTTVKDRDREEMKNREVGEFVVDGGVKEKGFASAYLWDIAGWRPRKIGE